MYKRQELKSAIAAFITWALNTENNKVTNYTQFPFIALGLLADKPVGAAADGLYLLEGADDNGVPIAATFSFGMADFKNELVGVVDAYVGGDIAADLELTVLEDGQITANTYPLLERERHVRGHHAKLGRGLRSRYRQFSVSNINGGDFTLNSFSLPPVDLKGNK